MSNWSGGIGLAFADRNFRIYSLGSIGSWISFFVQLVAVSWLTWQLTKSTTWLAAMALMDIVPNVVLMPVAGVIADRFDRYRILIITSCLLLLQAIAMTLLAWWGLLTIWPLAALVLLHGIFISFMVPAMHGTLPRFVDPAVLPSAIAVASSYTQAAVFIGPAIAGWIIAKHGMPLAFLVNALGYFALMIALLCLKTPPGYQKAQVPPRSIMGDIVDGFEYIRGNSRISSLLVLGLVCETLIMSFYHMIPAYSELIIGQGIFGVSVILACMGLGSTAAALWLAHGGVKAARVDRVLWAAVIAMLSLVFLVHAANLFIAAVIACATGFAAETRATGSASIIQMSVDEAHRGRVMGTKFMLSQLGAGIGTYMIGAIAVSHGLKTPIIIGVAIGVTIWLLIFLRHKKRPI